MIPVSVEGVRRTFGIGSVFMYTDVGSSAG
jgi:hypothetical protein